MGKKSFGENIKLFKKGVAVLLSISICLSTPIRFAQEVSADTILGKNESVLDGELLWSEEFDGNTLDMNNWSYETGQTGWGNQEFQNYTDGQNIKVQDGNLVIIPRMDYNTASKKIISATSTRINSKKWKHN